MKFAAHARSVSATELLLPILYVEVADLDEDSPDEAKALIAGTQYVDWRELRLADESSEPYTRAVHALANRLASIAREYEAKPSIIPSATASAEGDDEPGIIDMIAEMEPALPAWTETMTEFTSLLEQISDITNRHSARFQPDDNLPGASSSAASSPPSSWNLQMRFWPLESDTPGTCSRSIRV